MAFEGPGKTTGETAEAGQAKESGPKPGLIDWMVTWIKHIPRSALTSWLPALSAASLLASVVVFGLISYLAYEILGRGDASFRSVPMIAAFQIGVLITLFLSTLLESSTPEGGAGASADSKAYKFPFAVSLQASFIESIGITGTVIFLFAKDLIDGVGRIDLLAKDANAVELSEAPLAKLVLQAIANKDAHAASKAIELIGLPEILSLLMLAAAFMLALYGAGVLKQKSALERGEGGGLSILTSLFKGKSALTQPAPTSPEGLKKQIEELQTFRSSLRTKATAQRDLAKSLRQKIKPSVPGADVDPATAAERQALLAERNDLNAVVAALSQLIDGTKARSDGGKRPRSSTLFSKVLGYFVPARALLASAVGAFDEFIGKIDSEIEQASGIARDLEAAAVAAEQEAEKLDQDAKLLEDRIEGLSSVLSDMTADQARWEEASSPKPWTACVKDDQMVVSAPIAPGTYSRSDIVVAPGANSKTFEKYRTSVLWMFAFTVVAGVLDDLLLELPEPSVHGIGGSFHGNM